jgi:hypothetical protein
MEVSQATKDYFNEVAERVTQYFEALEFAKEFVLDQQIDRNERIVDCMLMSILWVASKREDNLTEEDVCTYLNVDVEVNKGDIAVEMVPEMQGYTLDEVLQYVNGIHGSE